MSRITPLLPTTTVTTLLTLLITILLLLTQFPHPAIATMTQLPHLNEAAEPTIITFQIQDSGYTEPGCGEPVRIEAAKQWARDLEDPTQVTKLNIVTYMEPHINWSDEKSRSEANFGFEWVAVEHEGDGKGGKDREGEAEGEGVKKYQMHVELEEYIGSWRNHLDRIYEKMMENVNEKVKADGSLTPAQQLEVFFDEWRGSYTFLG